MDIENPQQITLSLEVVPEDPQDADAALVSAVGLDTTEALRNDGYAVEPSYTGQRDPETIPQRHHRAHQRSETSSRSTRSISANPHGS